MMWPRAYQAGGATEEAEPVFFNPLRAPYNAVRSAVEGLAGLPGRLYGAAEQARMEGTYNPAPALEAATLTMGATPFSAPRGAIGAGPIRAYHGSPYDFDRFDLSKIGTGEGAQAYGHGLYFAGNENVARSYRDTLSTDPFRQAAEITPLLPKKYQGSRDAGRRILGDVQDALASGEIKRPEEFTSVYSVDPELSAAYRKAADIINSRGRMYEVNINADPAHLLDWDRPLSEQPQAARDIAASVIANPGRGAGYLADADKFPIMGQDLYRAMQARDTGIAWPQGEGPLLASNALREAGIPGLKYLDQGSRLTGGVNKIGDSYFVKGSMTPYKTRAEAEAASETAGNVTHNYVIFDDKLIDILRKYGMAGLLPPAAGVVAGQISKADANPFARGGRSRGADMPLVKGKSEGAFKQNVRTLMGEIGKSPHVQSRAQALAIAYSKKRSGKQEGGRVYPPLPDEAWQAWLDRPRSAVNPRGYFFAPKSQNLRSFLGTVPEGFITERDHPQLKDIQDDADIFAFPKERNRPDQLFVRPKPFTSQEGGRVVLPSPPEDPAYIKALAAFLARRKKAMGDLQTTRADARGGKVERDDRDPTPGEHVKQAFGALDNPAFRQSVTEMDTTWPRDYRFPLQFMPGTDVVRGQRPLWMQPGRPITDPTLGLTSPRDVRALQGGGAVNPWGNMMDYFHQMQSRFQGLPQNPFTNFLQQMMPRAESWLSNWQQRMGQAPAGTAPSPPQAPPWTGMLPPQVAAQAQQMAPPWGGEMPQQAAATPSAPPAAAAAAPAMPQQRWLGHVGYQGGGALKPINPPWYERSAARYLRSGVGLVNSGTPGRADAHKTSVPSGSYVVPAATLSALGQGNTMSGFNVLKGMFSPGRRFGSRMKMPKLANGGSVGHPVDVMLSGGEAVIYPDAVSRVGNGDIDKGHDYLDRWVTDVRNAWAKKLRTLPGPVK